MMKPPIDQRYAFNNLGIGLAIGAATANVGGELMFASGKIIALRVARGGRGMADPVHADNDELARILPEKAEIGVAARAILMQRSGEVAQQVTMFALDEMMLASGSAKMAVCCDPSAMVAAQGNMALAWFEPPPVAGDRAPHVWRCARSRRHCNPSIVLWPRMRNG